MSKTMVTSAIFFAFIVVAQPLTAADQKKITFESYGLARIGMSRADLQRVVGSKLKNDYADADTEGCEYVSSAKGYSGVSFMIIDQRVARIDVTSPTVSTLSGIRIGSSQSLVLSTYPGRITITDHAYTGPEGKYLTMHSTDNKYGIRFETDGERVASYYAGTPEAIQYIEGCL